MRSTPFVFTTFLLVASGCAGPRLLGKVTSCADQTPIEGAQMSVSEIDPKTGAASPAAKGNGAAGSAQDGSYSIGVPGLPEAAYRVRADKPGFLPGEADAKTNQPAEICMTPMPGGKKEGQSTKSVTVSPPDSQR